MNEEQTRIREFPRGGGGEKKSKGRSPVSLVPYNKSHIQINILFTASLPLPLKNFPEGVGVKNIC